MQVYPEVFYNALAACARFRTPRKSAASEARGPSSDAENLTGERLARTRAVRGKGCVFGLREL